MATITKYNKIIFSPGEVEFLKNNWETMTNQQLADHLGLKLTIVRRKLYELGLKRIQMEYWTEEMVAYLKKWYTKRGDTELAKMFQFSYPKDKPWTKKHIEKKRRYLGLKPTKKQAKYIFERNRKNGAWVEGNRKRWLTSPADAIGTIKTWGNRQYIKTEKGYVLYSRYQWQQHYGPIETNENVFHKDGNPLNNNIDNLYIITNQEQGLLSNIKKDRYEAFAKKKLLRMNNNKVLIDGKNDTIIKTKKVIDKLAVFTTKKTYVLTESEIPQFYNRLSLNLNYE